MYIEEKFSKGTGGKMDEMAGTAAWWQANDLSAKKHMQAHTHTHWDTLVLGEQYPLSFVASSLAHAHFPAGLLCEETRTKPTCRQRMWLSVWVSGSLSHFCGILLSTWSQAAAHHHVSKDRRRRAGLARLLIFLSLSVFTQQIGNARQNKEEKLPPEEASEGRKQGSERA